MTFDSNERAASHSAMTIESLSVSRIMVLSRLCLLSASCCFLVSAILSIWYFTSASAPLPGEAARKSFLHRAEIDLGEMRSIDQREVNFDINNWTDTGLTVENATPDCGCTELDLPSRRIEPGKAITGKVTFTAAGMQGDVERRIKVLLLTQDGRRFSEVLLLKAKVIWPIKFSPSKLHFRRSSPPFEIEIITRSDDHRVQPSSTSSPHRCLLATIEADARDPLVSKMLVRFMSDQNMDLEKSEIRVLGADAVELARIPVQIDP